MAKREIPKKDWHNYLESVSRLASRKVTVERKGGNYARKVAERVPLFGIEPEEKGSMSCAIDVMVGHEEFPSDRLIHSVRCPTKMLVEENDEGYPQMIDIESQDNLENIKINTIITFFGNPGEA
jgi:hypothetical protein